MPFRECRWAEQRALAVRVYEELGRKSISASRHTLRLACLVLVDRSSTIAIIFR